MGSCGEGSSRAIDGSVGSLVWVRRRNGSWWPGRILGADELPEGCVVSPRSGTPVKLLGREDASLDWYNLEKSKRVKAFRCGEYDECIEKAMVSAANSSRKAVKYARREHAIIHALEIENARHLKDFPEPGLKMDKPDDSSSSEDTLSSPHELSRSGVSFEEPNHFRVSKQKTPNDSEDDGSGGTKRMRGLEDLGMGVVSSSKRSEFLKKKSRRRQLAKVLESTAMIASPVGILESNELKRSLSVVINNNLDSNGVSCENENSLNAYNLACDASLVNCEKENEISSMLGLPKKNSYDVLFDVPFVGEEKHHAGVSSIFVSCPSQKTSVDTGAQCTQTILVETAISLRSEEYNESSSNSSGASKWQSKGKRNSRHKSKTQKPYSKKTIDTHDVFFLGWRTPLAEVSPPHRLLPYRQSRFTINPKYQTSDLPLKKYGGESSLYDVIVNVETIYRPQHVPYISLMSKYNGRPIIGHPVTVEPMAKGFSDISPSKSHRKSGILSKKIRKLSSFTGPQKQILGEKKQPDMEKLKGPAIACVPIKIVFSRINAALNSSMRPMHRVMTVDNS